MLTKTDLSDIRKIIREEIEAESKAIGNDLRGEIKLARIEIQTDIRELKDRVKNLEISVGKIEKDVKSIIEFFDKDSLRLRKRVEKIEKHLNLPSAS